MKIGVASTCLWNMPPYRAVDFAAKYEVYSIELWVDHLTQFDLSYRKLKGLLKANSLASTVHSISWDINISSFSKEVRDFSIKEIKKSIRVASDIESEIVVLHPGKMSFTAAGKQTFFDLLIESISELYTYSKRLGVKISIENMEPQAKELIVDSDDFNQLFNSIDFKDLYITMDLAHLGSMEKIGQFYRALKDRIAHIHISDITQDTVHIPIGRGILPFDDIVKTINKHYRGIYNIEFFNLDPEAKAVVESIRFLKKYG